MKIVATICWTVLSLLPLSAAQVPTPPRSRMSELEYFQGQWECSGKFTRSGASIEAHLQFESILDGKFVLFRHDDKPPHSYHAWAEWGWDEAGKQFVSSVQDSAGGLRLFHATGWDGDRLQWEGGTPGQTGTQRFLFEKVPAGQFRVSYSYQKDGAWVSVDSSTCTHSEVEKR